MTTFRRMPQTGRFAALAGAPGQDHRDPPELRLARRPARPPPGAPVVLLQAVELGRGIRRHRSSARRAPSCSPSRARSPSSSAPPPGASPLADAWEPRRAGSPPPTTSASTTCARTTRAPTSARRAATASPRSGPTLIDARAVDPGRAAAAHLGQRRARAGRHDRRPASSRSRSSSPTCPSTSPSSRATSSSPAPRPARRWSCRATSSRSRSTRRRAGRSSSGRLVTTVTQGDGTVRRGARLAARGRRHAARRGLGLARGRRPAAEAGRRGTPDAPTGTTRPVARAARQARGVPVAGLSAQLRKRGLNNVTIDGVRPMHPGTKLVGTARTLRFVPNREDLFDVPRRRLQRPEARLRRRRRGRGHRHRGPRRDRLGHARRHPRPPRPGARRRRHRHRRRRARLSTPSPPSASRSTPPARTPRSSAAGTCRGTST